MSPGRKPYKRHLIPPPESRAVPVPSDREAVRFHDAYTRAYLNGMREGFRRAAKECDDHAILNDAVETQPEHGTCIDPHLNKSGTATYWRAFQCHELAAAIRSLSPGEPREGER